MKIKIILIILIILKLTTINAQNNNKKTNPKIAVLGMFHFAGSTQDIAAIKLENPLGIKRQKEIIELVETLKRYKPTKILVEFPKSRNEELNIKLSNYLKGIDSLGISETYQIGFRLVELLNQKKIYAIDYKLNLPMNNVLEYSKRTNQMGAFNNFIGKITSLMNKETEKLNQSTVTKYLSIMNSNVTDQITNEMYLKDMLIFGDSISEAGINVSATWWKRNMQIFKNIIDNIENNDERLLVIIGSAHRAVIKDFIRDRSDVDYYEIGKLLID